MISCKETSELLSHKDLTFGKKVQLKFHLLICERCRVLKRQFDVLNIKLQRLNNKTDTTHAELAKKISDDYLKKD